MPTRVVFAAMVASFFGIVPTSCRGPTKPPPARPDPGWQVSLLENTIGGIAELEGLDSIPVRGYALAMGLAGTPDRCLRRLHNSNPHHALSLEEKSRLSRPSHLGPAQTEQ